MLRKSYRLLAIILWSMFMAFVCAAASLAGRFSRRIGLSYWDRFYRAWASGGARIIGMEIEVRGEKPAPPCFIVTNHITYADIFLLASQLGCVFVAKNELASWPVFGLLARVGKTIFINRARIRDTVRVNKEIVDAMDGGLSVALFPESSVSNDGELHTFKAALLEPCARMNIPVHYASIHYESPEGSPPASEVILWKDKFNLFTHFFNLASLPSFKAILTIGEKPISATDRKTLATELHQAIEGQWIRSE